MEKTLNNNPSEQTTVNNKENSFLQQYNKEIDEAMARIDQGHFISHEDLEKEMESW